MKAQLSRDFAHALATHYCSIVILLREKDKQCLASPARELIALLRNLGLVRSDADLAVQAYAFSALVTGAALVDQFLVEADRVPLEAQADAVALLAQRTFEPDTLPPSDLLRNDIAPALIQVLEQACAFYEQQLQMRLVSP